VFPLVPWERIISVGERVVTCVSWENRFIFGFVSCELFSTIVSRLRTSVDFVNGLSQNVVLFDYFGDITLGMCVQMSLKIVILSLEGGDVRKVGVVVMLVWSSRLSAIIVLVVDIWVRGVSKRSIECIVTGMHIICKIWGNCCQYRWVRCRSDDFLVGVEVMVMLIWMTKGDIVVSFVSS